MPCVLGGTNCPRAAHAPEAREHGRVRLGREVRQVRLRSAAGARRPKASAGSAAWARPASPSGPTAGTAAPRPGTAARRSCGRTRTRAPTSSPATTAATLPSVPRHRHEHRCLRRVAVPQVVVHELEVPDALAGLARAGRARSCRTARRRCRSPPQKSHAGEPIGRYTMPRRGVDADPAPGVGSAHGLPGVLRPGVVAELAGPRDRVEGPADGARAHVVGADVAGGRRAGALVHARAEDQQVAVHGARGRRQHEQPLLECLRLAPEPVAQVDAAVVAEARRSACRSLRRARTGTGPR